MATKSKPSLKPKTKSKSSSTLWPDNKTANNRLHHYGSPAAVELDRMFKSPADKRAKSLERITRNHKIYCAVFEKESPLNVIAIYEVEVSVMLQEAERQLDRSRNDISHIGFTIRWAQENGKQVYKNPN